MQFEKIIENLQSNKRAEVAQAQKFLYFRFRDVVKKHLWKCNCKDPEISKSIFHDALFDLYNTVRNNDFKGVRIESFGALLKRNSFFKWSKHKDNPLKEIMKRGGKVPEVEESNVFALHSSSNHLSKNIEDLSMAEERQTAVNPERGADKAGAEKIATVVSNLIKKLTTDCQERISRSSFFNPNRLFATEKQDVVKVSHAETTIDLKDKNEKVTRKQLGICKDKLKRLIDNVLKSDTELAQLMDNLYGFR